VFISARNKRGDTIQEAEICALWDLTKEMTVQLLQAQKRQDVISMSRGSTNFTSDINNFLSYQAAYP